MKGLLRRLYNYLTAPMYSRLSRDMATHMQNALAVNLDYQEKVAAKMLNDLTGVQLEKVMAPDAPTSQIHAVSIEDMMTDEEIKNVVNAMTSHVRIIEIACEQQISMRELMEMRSKYAGMDAHVIRKVRKLEKENLRLKQTLTRTMLEKVEPEAGIFS